MTPEGITLAVIIFFMRVANYAIGTLRLVSITRNMRMQAAGLAFVEALVYAIVIANVVSDLSNIFNLMAYCLGASAGSYLGMVLESRLIKSYRIVNIIATEQGHEIAVALREAGHGVTESLGQGRDSLVATLRCVVTSRDLPAVMRIVYGINEQAFIAVEEARAVRHGWLRQPNGHPR